MGDASLEIVNGIEAEDRLRVNMNVGNMDEFHDRPSGR
jgi:hypothetical protein